MRNIYYDTVLYSEEALRLLIKTVGVDRCVFGAECPGVGSTLNPDTGRTFDQIKPFIENFDWLSSEDKTAIFEGNATRLFKLDQPTQNSIQDFFMAEIVLGMRTSHGPMLVTTPDIRPLRIPDDRKNRHPWRNRDWSFDELVEARKPANLAAQITPQAPRWGDRSHRSAGEHVFQAGTSEIKNWIPVAGAMADLKFEMNIVDYVPVYRTEAGTGKAMGFVAWTKGKS